MSQKRGIVILERNEGSQGKAAAASILTPSPIFFSRGVYKSEILYQRSDIGKRSEIGNEVNRQELDLSWAKREE